MSISRADHMPDVSSVREASSACTLHQNGKIIGHTLLLSTDAPLLVGERFGQMVEPTQALSSIRESIQLPLNSSPSSKRNNSLLSNVYKQASELYLTRRLPECLALLEHSVFPWRSADRNGDEDENPETSLIVGASRGLRVKVWNLYLTLLNDIVDLGVEEGRFVLGNKKWREIAALVQKGTIWDEVIKVGYSGIEASVDAEVVANLATLLLSQGDSQKFNQDRIEGYLAGADSILFDTPQNLGSFVHKQTGQGYPSEREVSTRSLQDLNSRIKLLELYALHVLPRNNQWRYAEEFVSGNGILDADMKESFLQILDGLEKEDQERSFIAESIAIPAKGEDQKGEGASNQQKLDGKSSKQESDNFHSSGQNVENDYGIEDMPTPVAADADVHNAWTKSLLGRSKSRPPHRASTVHNGSTSKRTTLTGHALLATFQRMSHMMSKSLPGHPALLIRFALFILSIVLVFSRRDVRQRIKMLVGTGWERLSRTAGMGLKVSYL